MALKCKEGQDDVMKLRSEREGWNSRAVRSSESMADHKGVVLISTLVSIRLSPSP